MQMSNDTKDVAINKLLDTLLRAYLIPTTLIITGFASIHYSIQFQTDTWMHCILSVGGLILVFIGLFWFCIAYIVLKVYQSAYDAINNTQAKSRKKVMKLLNKQHFI